MEIATEIMPRNNLNPRNIGCAVIVGVVACTAFLFYFGHRGIWGVGKDVKYVNSIQYQRFDIPGEATDISYCFTVAVSTVDVQISRNNFMRWCQTRGWLVSEIQEDRPAERKYVLPDGLVASDLSTRGLQFDARHHDGHGFFGVFNESIDRASVVWTSGR